MAWINGRFVESCNCQVPCEESAQSDLTAHGRRAVTFGHDDTFAPTV
jgi:hypothetical protein